MTLSIAGLGTALPPYSVTCDLMAAFCAPFCCENAEQAEQLKLIFAKSGVRKKHTVLLEGECREGFYPQSFYPQTLGQRGPSTGRRMEEYERAAPGLAQAAAQGALAEAKTEPGDITHLVTASCTGFMAPGIDMALIERLGLRPTVERTHVGFMGCHGAFNALKVARGCLAAEPAAQVLVCCVELSTLHFFSGWDPEKVVANALFADGAGAVVCRTADPASSRNGGTGPSDDWRLAAVGTMKIPDSGPAMTWKIGDFGFDMGLSRRIPELIMRNLPGYITAWLDRQGLTLADIGSWAVHPGGPKILEAVERGLKLPDGALDRSHETLAEYGNMSSPTVLFIINRMRRENAPRPCVALGFGPGMVVEAALFV